MFRSARGLSAVREGCCITRRRRRILPRAVFAIVFSRKNVFFILLLALHNCYVTRCRKAWSSVESDFFSGVVQPNSFRLALTTVGFCFQEMTKIAAVGGKKATLYTGECFFGDFARHFGVLPIA